MSDLVLKTQWHYQENRKFAATTACTKRDVDTLISLVNAYVMEEGVKAAQTALLTKVQYATGIRQWIDYCWPDVPTNFEDPQNPKPGAEVPLLNPRKEDIRHWIRIMLEKEAKQPTTVQTYLAAVNNLYKALVWTNATRENPCADVRAPKDNRSQTERGASMPEQYVMKLFELNTPKPLDRKTVNEEERLEFLKRCRNQLLLRLWANSGLRMREAFLVTFEDFNLDEPRHVMVTGKGGKRSEAPLAERTVEALHLWAGYRDMVAAKGVKEVIVNIKDKTFSRHPGQAVKSQSAMWTIMAEMYLEADVPKKYWGAHSLRHYFVKTALSSGVPIEVMRKAARHESSATTIEIYGGVEVERMSDVAKVFDAIG